MTNLRLRPAYPHALEDTEVQARPPTTLDCHSAAAVYGRLKPYLALEEVYQCPGMWDRPPQGRDLFSARGFHYRVRWMPNPGPGWRRLQYDEFLAWYGIAPFDGRAAEAA